MDYEALFDVSNASVVETEETMDTSLEEPAAKQRKLNRDHVVNLADRILDGKVGCNFDTVITDNAPLVPY